MMSSFHDSQNLNCQYFGNFKICRSCLNCAAKHPIKPQSSAQYRLNRLVNIFNWEYFWDALAFHTPCFFNKFLGFRVLLSFCYHGNYWKKTRECKKYHSVISQCTANHSFFGIIFNILKYRILKPPRLFKQPGM